MSRSAEYAAEIAQAYKYLNRVAKAHGRGIDHILHDVALAHCDKPGFTHEKFHGVYLPISSGKGYRVTIPSTIVPAPAFNVYQTAWGDIVYSPLHEIGKDKRIAPIIEAP